MRILVTGSTGFIASQIISELETHGHEIIRVLRKKPGDYNINKNKYLLCDFNQDLYPDIWIQRLNEKNKEKMIDIVINTVGILQDTRRNKIKPVQELAPKALFEACQKTGIKKIIQLSALGADEAAQTDYALTKKASEDYLRQCQDIDWVILRPSMVFASGSYGGTSLMRGMAAVPFFIGVPGFANPAFQPIYIEDLAKAVRIFCEKPEKIQDTFDITGTEKVPYKQLLLTFRKWLGFGKAIVLPIPYWAMKWVTKLGDIFGGPLNTTSLKMMLYGNTTTDEKMRRCHETIGFTPRSFTEVLQHLPSYVQDRWHSRLYFLKPILKIILVLFWAGFIITLMTHGFKWLDLWKYLPAFVATLVLLAIYPER